MRHLIIASLALALAGCADRGDEAEVDRAVEGVNVIDESGMRDIMLTVADPNEAVSYFRKSAADAPDRIDLQRSLAASLVRAKQPAAAVPVWTRVAAMPGATDEDALSLVDALIRSGDWAAAEAAIARVPESVATFRRFRLEAMIADSNEDWPRADTLYQRAVELAPDPAGVLNNWGFSNLSRGDYPAAERLFAQALARNPGLFTAKNNLALARGAQREYELPVVQMTQTERAQLLHTLGLAAIKQGDLATGQTLLREAIDTHPQHFELAARALAALDAPAAEP